MVKAVIKRIGQVILVVGLLTGIIITAGAASSAHSHADQNGTTSVFGLPLSFLHFLQ